MTPEEAAEVEGVYAGTRMRLPGDTSRPFRGPHHTISPAGMFGSGYPEEVRLAARGTLVLPEARLFHPIILRALAGVLRLGATPHALVLVLPPARPHAYPFTKIEPATQRRDGSRR